jgi:hypothetical protein
VASEGLGAMESVRHSVSVFHLWDCSVQGEELVGCISQWAVSNLFHY